LRILVVEEQAIATTPNAIVAGTVLIRFAATLRRAVRGASLLITLPNTVSSVTEVFLETDVKRSCVRCGGAHVFHFEVHVRIAIQPAFYVLVGEEQAVAMSPNVIVTGAVLIRLAASLIHAVCGAHFLTLLTKMVLLVTIIVLEVSVQRLCENEFSSCSMRESHNFLSPK
jgi:hypothetical protein